MACKGVLLCSADREWLGGTNKDTETGWESSTAISKSADGSYVESGTDTQYAVVAGSVTTTVDWTRSFAKNFDANGDFTGGTETNNGIERSYDANWNVTAEKAGGDFIAGLTPTPKILEFAPVVVPMG
jgi:hypothetical protein